MNYIFDIGKVLIDFDFEGYVRSLFDEPAASAVIDAMWHNPAWSELDRGVMRTEEVIRLFIAKAPEYEKEIRTAFARLGECPKLRPYTIPMIKRLKAEGHGVYYLSNYFEFLIHAAPWALEFIPLTDGGIFSCWEQVIKPDHEIFRRLCDRYGLDPAESLFIDDSPANVEGARSFGLNAVLYTGQTEEEICNMQPD